ncbi:MAG: glycerol-3-phosphate acyltransferase [Chloroflexi bacterium]|nr:glycerol-3-phosphate acyltransferase [Chloroflexota bacterium]
MGSDAALYIAIAVVGYLLGSIPTAYVAVRWATGRSVMEYGTGNVGTMNVHRATNSKSLTVLVLAGDMLKGAASLGMGYALARAGGLDVEMGPAVGGVLAVVGHNYSVFLGFKGGKGIATSGASVLWFAPPLGAVWTGVFLVTVAVTKLMVVGQIVATLVLPVVAHVAFSDVALVIDALAALVFIRHAPRLKNVFQGTEPRLYYKARTPEGR